MAATIKRIVPVTRNQGVPVPGLTQLGQWIDSLVLVAGVAQAYTLPTDSLGNKGRILRLTCNEGPIYINFVTTAVVPGALTDGSAPVMLRTDLGPCIFAVPDNAVTMSVISPAAGIVTIEVFN